MAYFTIQLIFYWKLAWQTQNAQSISSVHNIFPINSHPCQESHEILVTVNRSIFGMQFLNVSARSYIIYASIHHPSTIQRFVYNISQQIGIFWKLKYSIQRSSHKWHLRRLLNDQMFIFYAIILWIHINWNGLKYSLILTILTWLLIQAYYFYCMT